jgi:hypothetical protein
MSWGIVAGIAGAAMRENFEDGLKLSRAREGEVPTPKPAATRRAYECASCGAPIFGVINENCQYCKRPAGSSA